MHNPTSSIPWVAMGTKTSPLAALTLSRNHPSPVSCSLKDFSGNSLQKHPHVGAAPKPPHRLQLVSPRCNAVLCRTASTLTPHTRLQRQAIHLSQPMQREQFSVPRSPTCHFLTVRNSACKLSPPSGCCRTQRHKTNMDHITTEPNFSLSLFQVTLVFVHNGSPSTQKQMIRSSVFQVTSQNFQRIHTSFINMQHLLQKHLVQKSQWDFQQ